RLKGLLFIAAALALAAPVLAAPPQVTGRAFVVENGATGEILLARDPLARVPIASITKLMTVLLTVERTRPSDVVTVSARAAAVGESSAGLRAGERLTVRELLEAALIQSANDAADALADYVGKGSEERFVALMNRRARQLGLRDTHYVRPDGLDATGHVSSARDVTLLARILMHRPLVRQIVRQRVASISGGRTLHTWNDLLSTYPGIFGVKTGHTSIAGWNEVAAARRRDRLRDAARQPGPLRAERRPDEAARLGLLALPRGDRRHERSRLCRCEGGLRAQAGRAGRGRFADSFAAGRLPAGTTGGRHGRGRAARVPGAVPGPGPDLP